MRKHKLNWTYDLICASPHLDAHRWLEPKTGDVLFLWYLELEVLTEGLPVAQKKKKRDHPADGAAGVLVNCVRVHGRNAMELLYSHTQGEFINIQGAIRKLTV